MTAKILKSIFFLQISESKNKQIVLIYKNFCKNIKLGYNFGYKLFLIFQYICQYLNKSLKILL